MAINTATILGSSFSSLILRGKNNIANKAAIGKGTKNGLAKYKTAKEKKEAELFLVFYPVGR